MMKNKFKAALKQGKQQLGMWSSLCSPLVAEILSQSKIDWILFDGEHSPIEISGMLPLLQAAGNGLASSAVRPPWNDPVLIKRVLDIGAQTILLPFVQSADEAKQAVSSCRYPMNGWRGVAGGTRASGYGRTAGYLDNASSEICVLVQIETMQALAQIDEISSVKGVDGVFIGPSDLAASMGHLGNPGHAEVQAAIKGAVTKIIAAGKAPGILALGVDDTRRYLSWGFQFVACNVDLRILVQGVDSLIDELSD